MLDLDARINHWLRLWHHLWTKRLTQQKDVEKQFSVATYIASKWRSCSLALSRCWYFALRQRCLKLTTLIGKNCLWGQTFLLLLKRITPGRSYFRLVKFKAPPGGTPLYKLYRYVPPHRVGFLRCFGLKTGLIHFAHFGLESGMVFRGTTGVYERIYRFNSKWVTKKEKYANSKWIWWVCLFAL